MYVNKGKISVITDLTHATVIPMFSDTPVSVELVIPFFLKECLTPGMDVVYTQFPDNTGIIIARMDGEWNHKIWDGVEISTGDIEIIDGDIITASVPSYNLHTHTYPDGTTDIPK